MKNYQGKVHIITNLKKNLRSKFVNKLVLNKNPITESVNMEYLQKKPRKCSCV